MSPLYIALPLGFIVASGDAATNTANNTQILLGILGIVGAAGTAKVISVLLNWKKPKADIAALLNESAVGLAKGSDGLIARYIALTESQQTKMALLEDKINRQGEQLLHQAEQIGVLTGRYQHVEAERTRTQLELDRALARVKQLEDFMRFTHVAIPPSLIDVRLPDEERDLPSGTD